MQYKTTIEVHTEAENQYEATDIAGAFLRGELNSGADLTVTTVSVAKSRIMKATLAACFGVVISAAFLIGNQVYYKFVKAEKKEVTSYAIQPPLSTNLAETQGKEFKDVWHKANQDRINSMAR
ncbi:MAG: hypothetical protein PHV55_08485 [Candidatus Omnitrophica bacterium]|nr:hypothetical protein [Candidatus Omnitrophota bacterium]